MVSPAAFVLLGVTVAAVYSRCSTGTQRNEIHIANILLRLYICYSTFWWNFPLIYWKNSEAVIFFYCAVVFSWFNLKKNPKHQPTNKQNPSIQLFKNVLQGNKAWTAQQLHSLLINYTQIKWLAVYFKGNEDACLVLLCKFGGVHTINKNPVFWKFFS